MKVREGASEDKRAGPDERSTGDKPGYLTGCRRLIGPCTSQDPVRLLSADSPIQAIPIASAHEPNFLERELNKALDSIRNEIRQNGQIREAYLEPAEREWAAAVGNFAERLGVESVKAAAKRTGATAVDRPDVQRGRERVSGRKKELKAWLLGVAGVLGGGATAGAIAVLLTPPASGTTVWWAVIGGLGVAAGALLRLAYPRKSRLD